MIHHNVVTETSRHLIDEYRVGMPLFLSSPRRTLLAEGIHAVMTSCGGVEEWTRLPRRATSLLDEVRAFGQAAPVIVGAVPFDNRSPVRLVVPERVRVAEPVRFFPSPQKTHLVSAEEVREVPPPQKYVRAVEQGLALLQADELEKVVLSRSMQFTSRKPVPIPQLLRNLARRHSNGYIFAVDLPTVLSKGERKQRTLIGASPELLVSRQGLKVIANPLAGSRARSEDPAEDRRRAAKLFKSAKDRHEHAVVVEAVAAALRPYCRDLEVPAEPSLVQTETLWHLSTRIVGELKDVSISSLQLAAALHPTPAVCGTPTDLAKAAIRALEPFDRGYYTGMVGWMDADGNGEWVVAIRCAEVEDRVLRLFAGAGIVVGSIPEEELEETSVKFKTMLHALGLE